MSHAATSIIFGVLMNCDFRQIPGTNDYVCARSKCQRVVKNVRALPIFAECRDLDAKPPELPPLTKKIWNFAWESGTHLVDVLGAMMAGDVNEAYRTPEQIAANLAICKMCEHYVDEACSQCGCPITDKRKAFADALAWKSKACPLNPPKWGADKMPDKPGVAP